MVRVQRSRPGAGVKMSFYLRRRDRPIQFEAAGIDDLWDGAGPVE